MKKLLAILPAVVLLIAIAHFTKAPIEPLEPPNAFGWGLMTSGAFYTPSAGGGGGGTPTFYYTAAGESPPTTGHYAGGGVARCSSITVGKNGNITALGAHIGHDSETNVKIALYDSNGDRLSTGDTFSGLGAQAWQDKTISNVAVTLSQVVWVCADGDDTYLDSQDSVGPPSDGLVYNAVAYATFPDTTVSLSGGDAGSWAYRITVE